MDETAICEDFTILGVIEDIDRLEALRDSLLDQTESDITMCGSAFVESLSSLTLRPTERQAVLIGLLNNDAARRTGHTRLLDDTFHIDIDRAVQVFSQQLIGANALAATTTDTNPRTTVETLVTVPPGTRQSQLRTLGLIDLPSRLRRYLLEAQSHVRIANPYFDRTPRIIQDIVALPRKGVETEILTREVDLPDHRAVLENVYEQLTHDERANLHVRELYAQDERGRQTAATHAKVIVIDNQVAYVGSANLTVTSLTSNFELGVVIHGPPVAEIAAAFDLVFENSTPVSPPG